MKLDISGNRKKECVAAELTQAIVDVSDGIEEFVILSKSEGEFIQMSGSNDEFYIEYCSKKESTSMFKSKNNVDLETVRFLFEDYFNKKENWKKQIEWSEFKVNNRGCLTVVIIGLIIPTAFFFHIRV